MIEKIYSLFLLLIILSSISAQLSDLEQNLIDVFGVIGNEPVVEPTTAPTSFKIDDPKGTTCICVPYYQCDPNNNTILRDSSVDGFGILDVRFSEETCQVSIENCCIEPREEDNPIQLVPHPERTASCGIRNDKGIDFQITGESLGDSQYGEFPWTVAILNSADSSSLCAGSLIHPSVILSAAHCLKKYRPLEMKIRAGEWDTQTDKERFPHQERAIDRVLLHPNFNDKTLANDIGLVFLKEPINIAENINPICLPSQDLKLDNTKDCFVTGWGKKNFGKTGRYSVIMKKVKMDTVPYDTCQAQLKRTRLGPKFALHKTFVCAGGKKGVDACEGDGGAPLVCPIGDGKYQQAGIVAWGIGCGAENVPGVYGYVSKFRKWIDDNMIQAGYDTKSYTPA